jgi:hypothetical protein
MAACLITISGTSGVIRINYTISGTPYTIETSIGEFYIEDTATDVTYTTLSGDLIAASLCLTITEVAASCYKLLWKNITTPKYIAEAIVLGASVITIEDTIFPNYNLTTSVNNAADDRVKIIGYKTERTTSDEQNFYYIFKVLGANIPMLRVRNADDSGYIYIHGELQADCLPIEGYTIVDPCYNTLPPVL